MRTYTQKLYSNARDSRYLNDLLFNSWRVYNHLVVLLNRQYRIYKDDARFKKELRPNAFALNRHLTKLKRTAAWGPILSSIPCHTYQQIAERVVNAYKLFFRNLKAGNRRTRPPRPRPFRKYASFTLKSDATGLCGDYVRVGKRHFRFHRSYSEFEGRVRTVTVKRDHVGDWYIHVVTDGVRAGTKPGTGSSAGFDFGMKTFLVSSDGRDVTAPLFFTKAHRENRRLSRAISRKVKGSNNRRKAVLRKARFMRRLANQRSDFQWKLANRLVREYDVMCFEDLNLRGMSARFGKKIGEYGFYGFLQKLRHLAAVYGREVRFVDRFYPSSKLCHVCGWKNERLALRDRAWTCPTCGTHHDRDRNAAMNILGGASSSGRGEVRPSPHGEAFAV